MGNCGELCNFTAKFYFPKMRNIRFIGSCDAKTDAKGRIFFPATFRKVMQEAGEEGMVMRKDVFQDCLVIYPESIWETQLESLRGKLSRWNSHEQNIFRQFAADAEMLMPDSNGRILLPRRYREMVGIIQDVRFIGMDDVIEVWAREKVDVPFMSPEKFSEELERLMDLG